VSQSSGNVTLNDNLTVKTTFNLQQGSLLLNGHTLTIEGAYVATPTATFTGSGASGLILNGTGNASLNFATGSAVLDTFVVSQTGGNVTLRSNLVVTLYTSLESGSLVLGNFNLTILGAFETAAGATITGSAEAGLLLNGNSNATLAFDPAAALLDTLVVSQISGDVTLLSDLVVGEMCNLQQGFLALNGNNLTIQGKIIALPGAGLIGDANAALTLQGSGDVSVVFEPGSALLGDLTVGQTGGNVSMTSNLLVGTLHLDKGALLLKGFELTVDETIISAAGATITGTPTSGLILTGDGNVFVAFSSNGYILGKLVVSQTNGDMLLKSDLIVANSLTLDKGLLQINGYDLTVNGTFTTNTGSGLGGSHVSGLFLNGFSPVSLVFAPGVASLDTLLISQSNGNVTMTGDLNVGELLHLEQGSLLLNGHDLTLEGKVLTAPGATLTGTAAAGLLLHGNSDVSLFFAPNGALLGTFEIEQGSGNVLLNNNLQVLESCVIESGTLVLNGFVLTSKGTFATTAGAYLSGNSNSGLLLDGTGDAILSFAPGNATLDTLLVSQTSGAVLLNSNLLVEKQLQLQSGHLVLGAATLTMAFQAKVVGGTENSYVVTDGTGSLKAWAKAGAGATFFPCGSSTAFFPAEITQSATAADVLLDVRVAPGVLSEGDAGTNLALTESLVDHTWFIEADNASAALDLSFTLFWNIAAEVNGFNHNKCYISHFENGAWDIKTGVQATAEINSYFSVSRTNISSLSPFRISDAIVSGMDEAFDRTTRLFPNPVTTGATAVLETETQYNMTVLLRMVHVSGQVMYEETRDLSAGSNTLQLPVDQLPAGVYVVDIQEIGQPNKVSRRLVKM
jgi:hypothetical protein